MTRLFAGRGGYWLCYLSLVLCTAKVPASDTVPHPSPAVLPYGSSETKWSLQLPNNETAVPYKGVVSFDKAGQGAAGMLYPAPNALGFLAGIITHGLIVESAKNSQKEKMRSSADQVLVPYQSVLSKFTSRELMQRGLKIVLLGGDKALTDNSESFEPGWLIKATPEFSIAQDQTAIILDNMITIETLGSLPAATIQNHIRVVSTSRDEPNITNFWIENEGGKLKEESAALFAQSLEIALHAMRYSSVETNKPFITFRYSEGQVEKMERGQLLYKTCDHIVIKNLRGWLMSIPLPNKSEQQSATGQCNDTSDHAIEPPEAKFVNVSSH